MLFQLQHGVKIQTKIFLVFSILTILCITLLTGLFISIVSPQYKRLINVFYETSEQINIITLALKENNKKTLGEALDHLRLIPDVENADLYIPDKSRHRTMTSVLNSTKSKKIKKNNMEEIRIPIREHEKILGILSLDLSYSNISADSVIEISILILLIAIYISNKLSNSILSPLFSLIETVSSIRETKDFHIRAKKFYNDEIGTLVSTFNEMIETIENQEKKQKLFYINTSKIASAMQSILENHDYTVRIDDQEGVQDDVIKTLINTFTNMIYEIHSYQKKQLYSERLSGMSDVGKLVLHQIGNTLNSAKTICFVLDEKTRQLQITKLGEIILFLQNCQNSTHDIQQGLPKKELIEYLSLFQNYLLEYQNATQVEFTSLNDKLQHIAEIIESQERWSQRVLKNEIIDPGELVDDALSLSYPLLMENNVSVTKKVQHTHKIKTDRIKVMQILVYLIENSIQSLRNNVEPKKIILEVAPENDHSILFSIIDNGEGIEPSMVNKIFSMDFNPPKNKPYFGLHDYANMATELGGKLTVKSSDVSKGAIFTLELPKSPIP